MTYPTMKTRERWRRQEDARDKLRDMPPEASDEEVIETATDYLLSCFSSSKIQLSILHDAGLPPVEYDWSWKNRYGITTLDPDRACLWIFECMRLEYGVFASRAKRGFAAGPGNHDRELLSILCGLPAYNRDAGR
jgi:hypothetical protein